MRKSFTLIELIFSMVIIAIAFTVLPKILQLSAKVSAQSLKEEALYSGVILMGYLKATAWDEQNTKYDDILIVQNGDNDYNCSGSNHIRKGGFVGSRNCENSRSASGLGVDSDDNGIYDDVDDFSSVIASNYNNSREYNLSVSVKYVEDISLSEEEFNVTQASETTNTKYIIIDINNTSNKDINKTGSENIAQLKFWTFNIGQIHINRIPWYE